MFSSVPDSDGTGMRSTPAIPARPIRRARRRSARHGAESRSDRALPSGRSAGPGRGPV